VCVCYGWMDGWMDRKHSGICESPHKQKGRLTDMNI